MPAKINRPTPPSMKAIFPKPKSCRGFITRVTKFGFFSSAGNWPTGLLLGLLLLPEKGSCSGVPPCGLSGMGAALATSLEALRPRIMPCIDSLRALHVPFKRQLYACVLGGLATAYLHMTRLCETST